MLKLNLIFATNLMILRF